MSALAALTPPFLVAAVVIAAIVAFLRHEMGRRRPDRGAGREDSPTLKPTSADEHADGAGSDADTAAPAGHDG